MKRHLVVGAIVAVLATGFSSAQTESRPTPPKKRDVGSYAVLVSKSSYAVPSWHKVVDTLVDLYGAEVIEFEADIESARSALIRSSPRFTAFVLRPREISRDVVARIHRLTRRLDDDPYHDTMWGIVTGRVGSDAQKVVAPIDPLIVKTALTTTGVHDGLYDRVFTLSDGTPDTWHEKSADGKVTTEKDAPAGKTVKLWELFAERFTKMSPDVIVTSSHGFQYGIEMPFSRGMFGGFGGRLVVFDLAAPQAAQPVPPSLNPKVFLPIGNCLVGDLDAKVAADSLLLTLQAHGGVRQAVGYTVETWYGRAGWGTLNLWQFEAGRMNVAEAFFFNQQQLIADLAKKNEKALAWDYDWKPSAADESPEKKIDGFMRAAASAGFDPNDRDLNGLLWDRDTVAFYGDPAWDARLDPKKSPAPYRVEWPSESDGREIRIKVIDAEAMKTKRTIYLRRPVRVATGDLALREGSIIADDFVILADQSVEPPQDEIRIPLSAK